LKDRVNVSMVQFAPEWLATSKNGERMRDYATREAKDGADLIIFPETSNVGHITPLLPGDPMEFSGVTGFPQFFQKYVQASEPVPGPTTRLLGSVAREYGVYIIVGISELHPVIPATLFDSAVLLGPHGLVGVQRKLHLNGGEKLFFSLGGSIRVHATSLGNIGLIVGYDVWFPEVSRILAVKGAEILCSICHGPSLPGVMDEETATNFAAVRSRENTAYFLVCTRAGAEGKYKMVGHSAVSDPTGTIISSADTDQETVTKAELTQEELVKTRGLLAVFRDRKPTLYSAVCEPSAPGCGILATQACAREREEEATDQAV